MDNAEIDRKLREHQELLKELRQRRSELVKTEWRICRDVERLREKKAANNIPAHGDPF